jgi:hypothetical protein
MALAWLKILESFFKTKLLLPFFLLFIIFEISHYLLNILYVPFENIIDIILLVLTILLLIYLSITLVLFVFKKYLILTKENKLQVNLYLLSFLIGLYYLIFLGIYSFFLYISEGTDRMTGWLVHLPVIGSIFMFHGTIAWITCYLILPVSIILPFVGFIKKQKENVILGLTGLAISSILLFFSPRLINFILD